MLGQSRFSVMARSALQGLNDVDWASLRHAYGPATDIPDLLLEIADGGADRGMLDQLFESLNHQGSVYPATAAAIPFLLRLLADSGKSELIFFLGSVAESGNIAVNRELSKGVSVLAGLFRSTDPEERESAARALGGASETKQAAIEALRTQLARETDGRSRVAITESLATLDERFEVPESAAAIERFRAACVNARRRGAETPDETVDTIVRTWRAAQDGEPTGAGEIVSLARPFPPARRLSLYGALLADTVHPGEAVMLAHEVLVITFPSERSHAGCTVQATRHFEGKHWILFTAGGSSFYVPIDLQIAYDAATAGIRSPDRITSMFEWLKRQSRQAAPTYAGHGRYYEFSYRGPTPVWALPLSAEQTFALTAIAQCGAVWEIATNLWFLYNLPDSRQGLAGLLRK